MNRFLTNEQLDLLMRLSSGNLQVSSLSNSDKQVVRYLKENGYASSVGFGDRVRITEEGRSYLKTLDIKEKRYISDRCLAVIALIISVVSLVVSTLK